MDEITIGEKVYISSKRAAKITGYAKDYVGQLCREGRVEARLVGRSWYVLESAIREHRFGRPNEVVVQEAPEEPVDRVATWQKPQYVPEMPVTVPNLTEKPADDTIGTPAIADMQTAWREWFAEKKPNTAVVDEIEEEEIAVAVPEQAPEPVIEQEQAPSTREDEFYEERVPVQRVYTETPIQRASSVKNVDIEPAQAAYTATNIGTSRGAYTEILPQEVEKKGTSGFGGAAVRALLVVVTFLSILVGLIGTGHAETLLSGTSIDFGAQNSLIDYLGGTSVYKSSL